MRPARVAGVGQQGGDLLGYAFGTREQDVTIFDPLSREVISRWPLGVTVRWLSNEQNFWDGQFIWTFDYPANVVQAVAIDPTQPAVVQRITTGGAGPAHSLMLMNDRRTAWINVAGENHLAVIDTAKGTVIDRVETGSFP